MEGRSLPANSLAICIQPDEGFHLHFEVKVPGAGMLTKSVNMEYKYAAEGIVLPDAYERLLLDALQGDASLFARADEIERSWELIDPIVAAWDADEVPLYFYEPGSWGPAEADALLAESGRGWSLGCQGA
jgi:glucose-6-phosphate 1-dehydrogenase